uniref:RNA-directed RNA polymerase L n=1 Tax=Yushu tick virus 1 TaxID=2972294 RepID=A0A9E7V295_9VIRU|nr:MAG: RNA-dependent RNA polymerase [Yushu tick virus 1]
MGDHNWYEQVAMHEEAQGSAVELAAAETDYPSQSAFSWYEATLDAMTDAIQRMKNGKLIPFSDLRKFIVNLRESRHEAFASMFQEANGMPETKTDAQHHLAIEEEFERLNVDQMIKDTLQGLKSTQIYSDVEYYTPDSVTVDIDEDGNPMVNIIDYSVTVNPRLMFEEKMGKYSILLNLYMAFNPNLTIVCLHPLSGRVMMEQKGRTKEWNIPVVGTGMKHMFARSIELVKEMTAQVPLEQKADFQLYVNTKMISIEREEFDIDLKFGIKVLEYMEMISRRNGIRFLRDSLSEEERKMFMSALLHDSRGEISADILLSRFGSFFGVKEAYSNKEYQEIIQREKEEVLEEARSFQSTDPPVEPTEEVIQEALLKHDSAAEELYEVLDSPKLVHHIPFHFRCKPDSVERQHALRKLAKVLVEDRKLKEKKEDDEILNFILPDGHERMTDMQIREAVEAEFVNKCKELEVPEESDDPRHDRIKAAYRALMLAPKTSEVQMLLDIFAAGGLSDEDYERFKRNEIKVARDLKTGSYITAPVQKQQHSVIKGDGIQSELPVEKEEEAFQEWRKSKNGHSISMKKGDVIAVRPTTTLLVKKFEERAGVGKKKQMQDEKRKVEKVKSLKFYSQEERTIYSERCLGNIQKYVDICIRAGAQIEAGKEDTLLKQRKKTLESQELHPEQGMDEEGKSTLSSESDSSFDIRPSKIYMEPLGTPPEPGRVKRKIDALSESSYSRGGGDDSEEFWRGLCHFGRNHQLFYENLSFVSQMASSGYRIVGSTNPGQFLVTFPSDSIMKGNSSLPFIVVTIVLPGDLYLNETDPNELTVPLKNGGSIHITMGRRVDRSQLSGHLSAYPRFMLAQAIIENLRKDASQPKMSKNDVATLYLFVNCININSSSILDNMRYMVEVCMGQYCYIDRYIEDKLMIPIKTELHMLLYTRMREMLGSINKSMQTVKMRIPEMDEEGHVDMNSMKIVGGHFESFLFSGFYQKPDQLIMELITMFFCTSKGLHGKHHNMVEIHKTPIGIQEPLDLLPPEDFVLHPVTKRHQYSPKVIRATTRAAEQATGKSLAAIRQDFYRFEKPDSHPASVPTLSSTSSTLVQECEEDGIPDDVNLTEAVLKEVSQKNFEKSIEYLADAEARICQTKSPGARKRIWRKTKDKIAKITGIPSVSNPITRDKYLEPRSGLIMRKTQSAKQKTRDALKSLLREEKRREKSQSGRVLPYGEFAMHWKDNYQFFDSGVVFTEVMRYSEQKRKKGEQVTISEMAKEHVRRVGSMKVAIRPKGQRTQKDREIFVIDLHTKAAIYLLEHMYKQICSSISAEKISVPGDAKVIDMYCQTKSEITWCKRMMESMAAAERNGGEKAKNTYCIHHDIDMTKWAPKDNLQKFYWVVACSRLLTLDEKFYYFGVLDIMWDKEIYIDDDVMLESMKSVLDGDFEAEECLFYRMTGGYKTNMVKVKQTWLQGQLNYISSFVHAGAMKLYEEAMHMEYPSGNCMVDINVHSDDNETTLCCCTHEDLDTVAMKSWSVIEYLCNNVCIELSKKKSSVSLQCKQFISIYNIGGEQIHPWVKPAMAVVSGLPYLTLADDMSSALSKISEAGGKGAPKSVMEMALTVVRAHVLDVHGLLERKTGKNKLATLLGVDESMMPMMLGGCFVRDWASFVMTGPKYIDKSALMHLLKRVSFATANEEPKKMAHVTGEASDQKTQSKTETAKCLKALKLFIACDLMCYDPVDDEESSTTYKGMNFLRPCKFKNRRYGVKMPFEDMSKEELHEKASQYKRENPCIMIKKPTNQEDLRKYCICQYDDPKFQDSLAGQSPNMLLLRHIQSRGKPRYRVLCTGSINEAAMPSCPTVPDDDPTGKMLAGCPLTLEELASMLKKKMDLTPTLSDCKVMCRRYISNDPEYKTVQFAVDNCRVSTAYRKLNKVPLKKPDFGQYSEVVNSMPDLIVYFCDKEFSTRNGFGLQHPRSALSDWAEIEKMFPREAACLKWRALKEPERMKNLVETLSLTEARKHADEERAAYNIALSALRKEVRNEQQRRAKAELLRETFEMEMRKRVKWEPVLLEKSTWEPGEIQSTLEARGISVPSWMKFRAEEREFLENVEESLPRDLVRMSRTFKSYTSRVIFTPPTYSDDIMEMTLQLRASLESTDRYQLRMHLSKQLTSASLKRILADSPDSFQWYISAIDAMSRLYELCRVLGMSSENLKATLMETRFCGKPLSEVKSRFARLPLEQQYRGIVPLYVIEPSYARLMVENMNPYLKQWNVVQEVYGKGEFIFSAKGQGYKLVAKGVDMKIEELVITHSGDLNLGHINRVIDDLSKDLRHFWKRDKSKVSLVSIFNCMPVDEGPKKEVVLDTSRNRLAYKKENSPHLAIKGLKVMKVPGELSRNISIIGLTPSLHGITCQDETIKTVLRHKMARDADLSLLDVPNAVHNGMRIADLVSAPDSKMLTKMNMGGVSFHTLISAMDSPGIYVRQHGTLHSKFFYRLFVPDFEDDFLDSRKSKKKSNFEALNDILCVEAENRCKRERWSKEADLVRAELESLEEENKYDFDDLVEEFGEDVVGEMTQEEIMSIIDEARDRKSPSSETKGRQDLLAHLHDLETKLRNIRPPDETVDIPEELCYRTRRVMTRLQHMGDLSAQAVARGAAVQGDLLSMVTPSTPVGLVDLAASPIDAIRKIPYEAIISANEARRKQRDEGKPIDPEDLFLNCNYLPLTDEESEVLAIAIGAVARFVQTGKAKSRLLLKKAWSSLKEGSREMFLWKIEELSAVVDSRTLSRMPSVRTSGELAQGWNTELGAGMEKFRNYADKKLSAYSTHFKPIEMLIDYMVKFYDKKTPQSLTGSVTAAMNKCNKRVETAKSLNLKKEEAERYVFHGLRVGASTATETSASEADLPSHASMPSSYDQHQSQQSSSSRSRSPVDLFNLGDIDKLNEDDDDSDGYFDA